MKMRESLRKAAILITALDAKSADRLLDQMGAAQAAEVRAAVMELDDVSPADQRRVLQEFLQRTNPQPQNSDGVVLDESLARRLSQTSETIGAPNDNVPHVATTSNPDSLAWWVDIPAEFLSQRLNAERPQIVAAVVTRLPPKRAAELLSLFSHARQAEIAEQLLYRDEADPNVIAELEQLLHVQFSDERRREERRQNGIAILAAIVAAAPADQRHNLAKHLSKLDPRLVDQPTVDDDRVKRGRANDQAMSSGQFKDSSVDPSNEFEATTKSRKSLPFEQSQIHLPRKVPDLNSPHLRQELRADDVANLESPVLHSETLESGASQRSAGIPFRVLETLDDSIVLQALRGVEPEVALLALAGASRDLMKRVVRRLPSTEAKMLQRQLELIGPVRLRDIEEAQRRVGLAAGKPELMNRG